MVEAQKRPLSDHAKAELRELASAPVPAVSINPGVIRRLLQDGLARVVSLPSPFKTHKGGACNHLEITDAGRSLVADL